MTDLISVFVCFPFGDAVLFRHVFTFGHHFGMFLDSHLLATNFFREFERDHFETLIRRLFHCHLTLGIGDDFTLDFGHFFANLEYETI